jgi:hypothetical protein
MNNPFRGPWPKIGADSVPESVPSHFPGRILLHQRSHAKQDLPGFDPHQAFIWNTTFNFRLQSKSRHKRFGASSCHRSNSPTADLRRIAVLKEKQADQAGLLSMSILRKPTKHPVTHRD